MSSNTEDSDLAEAYRATTYRGEPTDREPFDMRIGQSAPIDGPAAYITSDNPGSTQLSDDANRRRRIALAGELSERDLELIPAKSIADDDQWPDEHGFFVRGIARDDAVELAERYRQKAIVYIDANRRVSLIFCSDAGGYGT